MFTKILANADQKIEFLMLKFAEKCIVILHWFGASIRGKTTIVMLAFYDVTLRNITCSFC